MKFNLGHVQFEKSLDNLLVVDPYKSEDYSYVADGVPMIKVEDDLSHVLHLAEKRYDKLRKFSVPNSFKWNDGHPDDLMEETIVLIDDLSKISVSCLNAYIQIARAVGFRTLLLVSDVSELEPFKYQVRWFQGQLVRHPHHNDSLKRLSELFEYVGIDEDADSVFIDSYTGKVTATKIVNKYYDL